MEDELYLSILVEDGTKLYMRLYFSSNPPAVDTNAGCIGVELYDSHMREIDFGELDYADEDTELKDMVQDCIEFLAEEIKIKEYKETKMLKFINKG